jgi:ABC-type multidrug transport system fused ATPase/permease subunit
MNNFFKIISILNKKERKAFFLIILLSFLNSILDFLSIGAIYPLTSSILNVKSGSELIEKINIFIKENLGLDLIVVYLIIIILIFILRNIFNILFYFFLNAFLRNKFNNTSEETIKNYLNLNFQDFISDTFPKFQGNIINESNNLKNYIGTLINLCSELLILFSLTVLIFIVNIQVALIISVVFLIFILIYLFIFKSKTKLWGFKRNNISQLISKNLLEIYNSIRDIKILDKENFFINRFNILNSNFSILQFKYETLVAINKNIIELFILIVVSLAFITIKFNYNIYNLLPLISLYLVAFFRLYPSINRIINSMAVMKFYHTGIDYFYNERVKLDYSKTTQINKSQKINFLYQIELEKVFFRYDKSKNFLLEDVNIKIKKNQIIGIIGENGSGKSTLCNLLLGLLKPENGSIIIDDKININENYNEYKKILSFVPQKIYLLNDTIKNNILFGSEDEEIKKFNINKIKTFSKLLSFALNNDNNLLDNNIGEDGSMLSGGQKQRVAIARALYKESEILIMDEPNNNLDAEIESKIIEDLVSSPIKRTIIIISHNKSSLKFCDNIIEVKDRKVNYIN